MSRIKQLQMRFSAGALDPLLAMREDMEAYFSGAAQMTNVLSLPQGGFTRRPGEKKLFRLRRQLTAVGTGGATKTAPNGGTVANLFDGDEATELLTTTDLDATDNYVVAEVDFGAPTLIAMIDLVDMHLIAGGGGSTQFNLPQWSRWALSYVSWIPTVILPLVVKGLAAEFRIQYWTGAAWVDFGDPIDQTTDLATRRRSSGDGVTAQKWRFVRVGVTNLNTRIGIKEMKFWVEGALLSESQELSFTYSKDERYALFLTDRNIDVVRGGVRVASIPTPWTSAEVPDVDNTQSNDTMICCHEDVAPWRIFRESGDQEWDSRAQDFKNVPIYDYGRGIGGADAIQEIHFRNFAAGAGKGYTISLEGERTGTIVRTASYILDAPFIQAALRELPNTSATGITAVGSATEVLVTFSGDDGVRPWDEMELDALGDDNAEAWATTEAKGELAGEAVFSDAVGYPKCAAFYQSRLFMGGFKSLKNAILYSVTASFFDLDNRTLRDDRGLLTVVETTIQAIVQKIFPGRHLQVFTSDAEFYIPKEPITPKTSAVKFATGRGIEARLPVVEVDGASLFIQRQGKAMREFLFSDAEQDYRADNISLLSSHLINAPVSFAHRRAASTNEMDLVMTVNGDGTMAVLTTLRSLNITGFAGATRALGTYKQAGVDKEGTIYFVVEQTINAVTDRWIVEWDATRYLDFSTVVNVAPNTTVLNDLDDYEGETLHLMIDGSFEGTALVTGGSLTLPVAAQASVEVGYSFTPLVKTMPVKAQLPDGSVVGRMKRVLRVYLGLDNSSGVAVGANGKAVRDVPLRTLGDDLLDVPPTDVRFTGVKRIGGIRGWSEDGQVVVTQIDPGPFTCTGIGMEVVL